jgi:ABC-type transport system substrate-binding protein
VTVSYASNDVSLQSQAADEIIARLQAAGIKATARVLPTAQFDNTAQAPAKAPDIMLVHFYPDDAFPGSLAYLVFQCGTPLNYLGYCNKQADNMFNSGFTNSSASGRSQQFLTGAKLGFDAGSFLGLADLKDVIVYRPGLANLVTYPVLPWNFNYALATATH